MKCFITDEVNLLKSFSSCSLGDAVLCRISKAFQGISYGATRAK